MVKKLEIRRRAKAFLLAGITSFTLVATTGCSKSSEDDPIVGEVVYGVYDPDDAEAKKYNEKFEKELKKSKSEAQREFLGNVSTVLGNFNIDFANNYLEEGKDIKAALSWDEVVALGLAYNNYGEFTKENGNKEKVAEIFNGAVYLNGAKLKEAFNSANLVLACAHVIETREHPVQITELLESEEAKAFYNKYHELFLKTKETTDEEQLGYIDNFYKEVRSDFPITPDIREVGMVHSDPREAIKPYMFSVVPMITAMEMMYQNLDTKDHTLSDKEIYYLNDIGICNRAFDQFDVISNYLLNVPYNSSYANYDKLRDYKIKALIESNSYVVDDKHRDLSQLDRFKERVNVGYQGGYYVGSTYTVTSILTDITTKETSDRDEAVKAAGEDAVKKAEEEVDRELEEENEKAKEDAMKDAEEELRRQQEEADEESRRQQEEIEKDDKDLQDDIDDANDKIDNGDKVNEDDFGDHDVTFDDDHSGLDGDLNSNVTDITTDGDGVTYDPLPDPNSVSYSNVDSYDYAAPADSLFDYSDVSSYEDTASNTNEDAYVYVYHN